MTPLNFHFKIQKQDYGNTLYRIAKQKGNA